MITIKTQLLISELFHFVIVTYSNLNTHFRMPPWHFLQLKKNYLATMDKCPIIFFQKN